MKNLTQSTTDTLQEMIIKNSDIKNIIRFINKETDRNFKIYNYGTEPYFDNFLDVPKNVTINGLDQLIPFKFYELKEYNSITLSLAEISKINFVTSRSENDQLVENENGKSGFSAVMEYIFENPEKKNISNALQKPLDGISIHDFGNKFYSASVTSAGNHRLAGLIICAPFFQEKEITLYNVTQYKANQDFFTLFKALQKLLHILPKSQDITIDISISYGRELELKISNTKGKCIVFALINLEDLEEFVKNNNLCSAINLLVKQDKYYANVHYAEKSFVLNSNGVSIYCRDCDEFFQKVQYQTFGIFQKIIYVINRILYREG